ncbi:AAA family ATPase [Mumia sp. DW29H23]|uniref:AAA family ATPase n=1 Tax=Mumia sp. DW29H23 TaxID=3421241 RepID=UPI003D68697F
MAQDSAAAVPSAAGDPLDRQLLDAKFRIPEPRAGSVSRARLVDRARDSGARAVGVTAPAGYGKSTLLAQWAATEERPVAWVSLDRFDDDPAVLLAVLASAYAQIFPERAELVTAAHGVGLSPLGRTAPRLATFLRTSPRPFVLVVDDLHELRSAASHDVLGVVVSGVPEGSQLVAASRSEQPHLARLRAAGSATEIASADLALDAAGAAAIFAEARVPATPEELAVVTDRTEGWPVGLYLAALIAGTREGDVASISGDDRFVADYLYGESLSPLPEATQRFLRRTAVLDQLSGPLCDALLESADGQEQLQRLEATNAFLVPMDRRRSWYRYHALFREFLLGELRRVEPKEIDKLHLRAADWYESAGSTALALEHLLNTSERDRCVQLAAQLTFATYEAGNISTVQRWLSTLGDGAVAAYPPLAVLAGWVSAVSGNAVDALRWASVVDAASYDQAPVDGTASFASGRAMLRAVMCPDGPERMMEDALVAVAEEPAWSPWRDTALCLQAEAHLLAGDAEQARTLLSEASSIAVAHSNSDGVVVCEAELAFLAMDRGRWDEAAEHVATAMTSLEEHRMHGYATSVLAVVADARLALHGGELKRADRSFTQAMRSRPMCTVALPIVAVRVRLGLAKIAWSRGEHASTRHLLREIDDLMLRRPHLGALGDEVTALREMVDANAAATVPGSVPLTPAELRLLPYLQTHLTIGEIGERLFISRNTVRTEVASIYRKLGVSSRSEAVDRATGLGLLGA